MYLHEDDTIEIPEVSASPSAADVVTTLRAIRDRVRQDSERDEELAAELARLTASMRAQQEARFDASSWTGGEGDCRYLRDFASEDGQRITWRSYVPSDELDVERGLLDSPPNTEWHHRLQYLWGLRSIARGVIKAGDVSGRTDPNRLTPKFDRTIARHLGRCPESTLRSYFRSDEFTRIFGSASGSGGDWIPSEDLVPRLEETLIGWREPLANQLERITTRSGRIDLPFLTAGGVPYLHGMPASDTSAKFKASDLSSTSLSATLQGIAVRMIAAVDALEDAVFDAGPLMMRLALRTLAYAVDDYLINGDSAATHQDTGIGTWNPAAAYSAAPGGGSDDHRRAGLGWRAEAADNSATTDAGTSWTWDAFVALLQKLDSAHAALGRVVTISSYKAAIETMKWDEFQGLDKVGVASVLTAASIGAAIGVVKGGVPLLVSPFVTEDLAATGLYTGSGALTGVLAVDLAAYAMVEDARGSMSANVDDVERGTRAYVTRRRIKMLKLAASSKKTAAWAYNI